MLLVCVLCQASDPSIEKIERVAGSSHRGTLWSAFAVEIYSDSGFTGDLVAESRAGYSFACSVELGAGARKRFILPSIDAARVTVGKASVDAPVDRLRSDMLVGVDARVPYAADLVSTPQVGWRVIAPEDLKEILSLGLAEAFDLMILPDASGLAASRADVEQMLQGLQAPPRIESVDRRIWDLEPRGGWVPVKKSATLLFATVYAFAFFAVMGVLGRRHGKVAFGALLGVAIAGVAVFYAFFPRGRVWIVAHTCEVVPVKGDAAEWRVWFAGAGTPVETRIVFPRLVKPVLPPGGERPPFRVRVEGRGCRVEGLRLAPGLPACFAGVVDRPTQSDSGWITRDRIYRASILIGNRNKFLGDLSPGTALPQEVADDGPPPRETDFAALGSRFVSGDCLFGWLDPAERPARDVSSPDLADARDRPRFRVRRLR